MTDLAQRQRKQALERELRSIRQAERDEAKGKIVGEPGEATVRRRFTADQRNRAVGRQDGRCARCGESIIYDELSDARAILLQIITGGNET